MAAVQVRGLGKSYGRREVLARVDLDIPAGSVLALLGPNGAGKTTTVRILATLLRPDAGTARVLGLDVVSQRREVRRRIGLTGQNVALDDLQTGRENLRTVARLAHVAAAADRAADLLAAFGLTGAADRLVRTYSGGMRRRLDLAAGLLTGPEVLFLDEPTTGLDPRARQDLWAVLDDLVAAGTTIVLTTQYLEEADRLAAVVAVLDHGRVTARGAPAELKALVGGARLEVTASDADARRAMASLLAGRPEGHSQPADVTDDRRLTVTTDGSAAHARELLDRLDPDRSRISSIDIRTPSLDDVFLAITGHGVSGDAATATATNATATTDPVGTRR
ncbi:MAG: ATP-binding cassette domain-containing protein [Kineosporiaceae bacterium]